MFWDFYSQKMNYLLEQDSLVLFHNSLFLGKYPSYFFESYLPPETGQKNSKNAKNGDSIQIFRPILDPTDDPKQYASRSSDSR